MAGVAISLFIAATLAILLAALFGVCIYWLRRVFIRDPAKMERFLDRRFDVIRRKGFWGEQKPFIDEVMIKRWGRVGWGLIPLPAINLLLEPSTLWSLGGHASVVLLAIAGMFFGDSLVGVHFLRVLGVDRYQPRAESGPGE